MGDNLQAIVDEMRAELRGGSGGYWQIHHDSLPAPIFIEIIRDGSRWLLGVDCDGRSLCESATMVNGVYVPVDIDELLANIYVLIRRWIKAVVDPPKLS
jgi:hypothetical protein